MSEWFEIPDLEQFADKVRAIVYNNFGAWGDKSVPDELIDDVKDEEQQDLDRLLSLEETLLIVKESTKKQKNKYTKEIRYILNDTLFADIIENTNNRMVSNILQSLVNKGLVESSYDSDAGDFVFWVKDTNDEKTETD